LHTKSNDDSFHLKPNEGSNQMKSRGRNRKNHTEDENYEENDYIEETISNGSGSSKSRRINSKKNKIKVMSIDDQGFKIKDGSN
jgi:hypothetical protein